MRILVFIMAGGKGKRIGLPIEKPLLPFLGKPLIEWIVEAVRSANKVSDFYVITSRHTLETEKKCLRDGLETIRTDGKGYHDDLRQAVLKIQLRCPLLTVSSDLPALSGKFLDKVISSYENAGKDALTVLVPLNKRKQLGLSVSSVYTYEGVAYAVSGINLIDAARISEAKLDEHALITEAVEAVLNVNTLEDLEIAKEVLECTRSNS